MTTVQASRDLLGHQISKLNTIMKDPPAYLQNRSPDHPGLKGIDSNLGFHRIQIAATSSVISTEIFRRKSDYVRNYRAEYKPDLRKSLITVDLIKYTQCARYRSSWSDI